MGINANQQEFVEKYAFPNVSIKKLLELGNQRIKIGNATEYRHQVSKDYYSEKGWDHTSVDLNGLDRSVIHDLSKPKEEWVNQYPLITDHGTLEHIEGLQAQYDTLKNLHDWGVQDCVYIHILPCLDYQQDQYHNRECLSWVDHGFYSYSTHFWEKLIEECGYRKIYVGLDCTNLEVTRSYCTAVYIKTPGSKMMDMDIFCEIFKHNSYHKNGSPA